MVPRTSILLQIISLSLFGGDYYFTYRFEAINIVPVYEKFQVSRKMVPMNLKPIKQFQITNEKDAINEKEFVQMHKDEIVEIILAHRTVVKSTSKLDSSNLTESSTLSSSPTVVNVDFKEDFGIIGVYE